MFRQSVSQAFLFVCVGGLPIYSAIVLIEDGRHLDPVSFLGGRSRRFAFRTVPHMDVPPSSPRPCVARRYLRSFVLGFPSLYPLGPRRDSTAGPHAQPSLCSALLSERRQGYPGAALSRKRQSFSRRSPVGDAVQQSTFSLHPMTPNQALQRTPCFGVQLPGAALIRPAQSRAVLPAMKPGTARAFALRRRAHSRAPGRSR